MFKYLSLLIILLCLSCKDTEGTCLSSKDTTQILQAILNSKGFVKDAICYTDSLYFLKTKYFNNAWPAQSNYFRLIYINDVPQARIVNFGPNYPYDGRRRFSLFYFAIKKDTSTVKLLEHGGNLFFVYRLKAINDKWTVIEEDLSTGGRRTNYGFEKEQWYLDMKKKIKPVKPMFPPVKPLD
jgi:hypothetical protein